MDGSFHDPLCGAIKSHLELAADEVLTIGDIRISNSIVLPGRFKRVYVKESFGVPFIGGKEIGSLDPRTEKHLSLESHGPRIAEQLCILKNQVLITCSGTIGRAAIAPSHWEGWAASQHIIRVNAITDWMAGYLYAWLSTDYARALIRRFTYGAVVDEVSSEHIGGVIVPMLSIESMRDIGTKVLQANELRSEAFKLEQESFNLFDEKVLGITQ
jgi:type I restriction enzyme S subunit